MKNAKLNSFIFILMLFQRIFSFKYFGSKEFIKNTVSANSKFFCHCPSDIAYKQNRFSLIKNEIQDSSSIEKLYVVYLLINTLNNRTYIGTTNNITRRLRQHNGEIVGGAKYTLANKGEGEWKYYGFIENLGKIQALSIEKRIQIKSRKQCGKTPLERRLAAINFILHDYKDILFRYLQ